MTRPRTWPRTGAATSSLASPRTVGGITRRRLLGAGAGLGAGLLLGACGDDAPAASPSGGDDAAGTGRFPVRVGHAYGSTEVPGPPERVVTAGLTEQDALLALGVVPVGVTEWYGEHPSATWPWAQDELGDAHPEVLSLADGFDFERIAGLAPDLVVATNAGITAKDYATMSQIAPTLAHSGDHTLYFEPWDVQALAIGAALGRQDEAQAEVDRIGQLFADARTEHPEFEGTRAVFLQNAFYDGSVIAYQDGLSTAFLTDLGFVVPDVIGEFQQGEGQAYIPKERMIDVLDQADVLVWGTETDADRAAFEADPVFRRLEAYRKDRNVYTGGELAGAIYFTSLLSLPYVVRELVPLLAAVLAD
jgi:iron complex transport system substrate-binding protein